MTKKKITLFIVEGPADETSFFTVLSRISASDTVRFQAVHGDVFTQDFMAPDKIVTAVNKQIKLFRGSIYKRSDFINFDHVLHGSNNLSEA